MFLCSLDLLSSLILRFEFHALPAPSMLDQVEESGTSIWRIDDLDRVLHILKLATK